MKRIFAIIYVILLAACAQSNHTSYNGKGISKLRETLCSALLAGNSKEIPVINKEVSKQKTTYEREVKKFKVKFSSYTIDAQKDYDLVVGKRGTILHIYKNSFVDKNGDPIVGKIKIRFREFTNPAEIAFSDIPMVHSYEGEEFCFNSAGMFELRGTDESGQEIFIGRNKRIDMEYELVQEIPNTSFFKFNEEANQWKKIRNIDRPTEKVLVGKVPIYRKGIIVGWKEDTIGKNTAFWKPIPKLNTDFAAGHMYPELVRDLPVSQFGVYNCDQIYRLPNLVSVKAFYKDRKTGKEIDDLHILSLVDLDVNAAFSFGPKMFLCDYKAKNVLLLFSKSGALYYADENSVRSAHIEKDGDYTFDVTDISDQVKTPEQLKNLLKL